MVQDIEEEYKIPVKLTWTNGRGFHLNIAKDKSGTVNLAQLPDLFHRVQKSKASVTCVTEVSLDELYRLRKTS